MIRSLLNAIMIVCPGVTNDGRGLHSMRDFCSTCAPFWEEYPTCPIDGCKLSQTNYCSTCKTKYLPAERRSE